MDDCLAFPVLAPYLVFLLFQVIDGFMCSCILFTSLTSAARLAWSLSSFACSFSRPLLFYFLRGAFSYYHVLKLGFIALYKQLQPVRFLFIFNNRTMFCFYGNKLSLSFPKFLTIFPLFADFFFQFISGHFRQFTSFSVFIVFWGFSRMDVWP